MAQNPHRCQIEQIEKQETSLWNHSIESLKGMKSEDPFMKFVALFHDVGKMKTESIGDHDNDLHFYNHNVIGAEICLQIAERLKFTNKQKDLIFQLVNNHMFNNDAVFTSDGEINEKKLKKFYNKHKEYFDELIFLRQADEAGNVLLNKLNNNKAPEYLVKIVDAVIKMRDEYVPLSVKDLVINGNDLMQMFNLKPSPLIGEILEFCLELVLDNQNNNDMMILHDAVKEMLEGI